MAPISFLAMTECFGNHQPCESGQMCVPASRVCDTIADCPDGSDESNQCPQGELIKHEGTMDYYT